MFGNDTLNTSNGGFCISVLYIVCDSKANRAEPTLLASRIMTTNKMLTQFRAQCPVSNPQGTKYGVPPAPVPVYGPTGSVSV